jgi:YidC/Oxa1 family membrane protein insertase
MQSRTSQQEPPGGNFLLFIALTFLLLVGWYQLKSSLWPPPPESGPEEKKGPEGGKGPTYTPPNEPLPTPDGRLLELGERGKGSRFHLHVKLDPRGAGVRQVTLNQFLEAREDGKPTRELLDLVPDEANKAEPAFLLYHFDPAKAADKRPLDALGQLNWKLVRQEAGPDRHLAELEASIDGFRISKTYTLAPGEYHLGLEVKVTREAEGEARFRYQLTGAKGLPVEGKWYATTFRNALIAVEDDSGRVSHRDIQDLAKVSWKGGGDAVVQGPGANIRYAGVAVQFFASVIVVDDEGNKSQKFLASARPTLERGVIHGKTKGPLLLFGDRITVTSNDGKLTETIYIPPEIQQRVGVINDKTNVAILYRTLGWDDELKDCPKLALDIRTGPDADATHATWEDDITVRVNTEPSAEMKKGSSFTHRYVLYNGPVKPLLLGYLRGADAVPADVVARYTGPLKLGTLIDWQMPGWAGSFFAGIGWTWLVIQTTNLIHWVLNFLHGWVGNLGACIILLTVIVRLVMFPLSRKQAMMALKMQELAPELKKLHEKYKDPEQRHELALAQWALYKKHGVNPMGSCWILLLQMPMFLGLFYALGESITFRLGGFWPTWIANLSAPDMMIHWGRGIWLISRDADYGSMLYLGPYLNILPIIAVVLMMYQQKMMTPPPADEQQEMQQKIMSYMMIFFGLMFYKVAAGLCLYYIVTTVWGFAERYMLPKADPGKVGVDLAAASASASPAPGEASDRLAASPQAGVRKKGKKAEKDKEEAPPGWGQKLADWWNDILEKAKKK